MFSQDVRQILRKAKIVLLVMNSFLSLFSFSNFYSLPFLTPIRNERHHLRNMRSNSKDNAPRVFHTLGKTHFHFNLTLPITSYPSPQYILFELGFPGKTALSFISPETTSSVSSRPYDMPNIKFILKEYFAHVQANPHTFLNRCYGLHRVKLPKVVCKIHFVIMSNLFPPHQDVHEAFDLKGSMIGQTYPGHQGEKNSRAILKDLNWINKHKMLELGPKKRASLTEQLRDTEFFEKG